MNNLFGQAIHSRAEPAPREPRGFTLIELLVVIAIIALLVSLLLPALRNARRTAQVVKCTSNAGQIGKAFHSYLNDYDDTFPVQNKKGQSMQWAYGGYAKGEAYTYSREDRPLNPYLGLDLIATKNDVAVFRCTEEREVRSTRESQPVTGPLATQTPFDVYGNSYRLSFDIVQHKVFDRARYDSGKWTPTRTVSVRTSMIQYSFARVILLGEAQVEYSAGGTPWDAMFHNENHRANAAFMDGHARYLQLEFGEGQTETYSTTIAKHWYAIVEEIRNSNS